VRIGAQDVGAREAPPSVGTLAWGAKFDQMTADPDADWVRLTPTQIDVVRASVATAHQTLFASTDEYGICLCSRDNHVADVLATAEFSVLMALHGLAKERGGERPVSGRRIIIPANPGAFDVERGRSR
jgi:hypothetical protein